MKLVTHNGRFHYDEVLSSAVLLKIWPDAELIRTRDPSLFDEGDIVYDVGGIFDPEKNRFDHHQATFSETFSQKHHIKLSSSGLIFKYFHRELFCSCGVVFSENLYETVLDKVYTDFFLYADALDNGYDIYGDVRPRSIADLVSCFNTHTGEDQSDELENRRFNDALRIVKLDLENYMCHLFQWICDHEYVEERIRDTDGPILSLGKHCSTTLILSIERKYGKDFKYAIFPSGGTYKILAIPMAKGTFKTKNPLNKEWCGLPGAEISKISGIDGCIFVHHSGFLGINETREGAVKMGMSSLQSCSK